MNAGQAIVLFDGLDEVNQADEQRAHITTSVNNFSRQYAASQGLITCRIAATDYAFDQFTYVEMADFDDPQIRTFVGKWFKDNPAKRDKFLTEFEKEEHKGLRELAQIPLLLTLLCLAFDETMSFPQRRVELYEEALDALLKKWDSSRNIKRDEIYRKLSLGRKRQMLARIAAETFEGGEYFFRQADLVKRISRYLQKLPPADFDEDIDGEAVLKAIEAQHSLLVERAHKIYSFSHLTFQKYFTAKYIAEDASEGTLARVIEQHLTDDRWQEVFQLIASLLPEADTFFVFMQAAIDELIRGDEKLMEVIQWAEQKAARDYAILGYYGRRCALDLAIDLEQEVPFFFPIYNLPYELDRSLGYVLDLDYELAQVLTLARNPDIACDPDIGARYFNLYHSLKLSQEFDLPDLHRALARLTIPVESAMLVEWQTFIADLQAIMISYRKIGYKWNLLEEQVNRVGQFQKANDLLLDCLKLAYVLDRAGIENSLWLPPGEKRDA